METKKTEVSATKDKSYAFGGYLIASIVIGWFLHRVGFTWWASILSAALIPSALNKLTAVGCFLASLFFTKSFYLLGIGLNQYSRNHENGLISTLVQFTQQVDFYTAVLLVFSVIFGVLFMVERLVMSLWLHKRNELSYIRKYIPWFTARNN